MVKGEGSGGVRLELLNQDAEVNDGRRGGHLGPGGNLPRGHPHRDHHRDQRAPRRPLRGHQHHPRANIDPPGQGDGGAVPRPPGRRPCRSGREAESLMHRRLTFLVVLVMALLLQLTVSPEISVGVVKPDILLVATICWALFEGPGQGALFGFWRRPAGGHLLHRGPGGFGLRQDPRRLLQRGAAPAGHLQVGDLAHDHRLLRLHRCKSSISSPPGPWWAWSSGLRSVSASSPAWPSITRLITLIIYPVIRHVSRRPGGQGIDVPVIAVRCIKVWR